MHGAGSMRRIADAPEPSGRPRRAGARIIGAAEDDAADAAAGGGVVAGAAGNQVQVAVEHRLAGGFAVVGAEIETDDGRVRGLQVVGQFFREAVRGRPFFRSQLAEGSHVAAGNHEGMAGADGKPVAEGDAGPVGGQGAPGRQLAEWTGRIHRGRIGPEDRTRKQEKKDPQDTGLRGRGAVFEGGDQFVTSCAGQEVDH